MSNRRYRPGDRIGRAVMLCRLATLTHGAARKSHGNEWVWRCDCGETFEAVPSAASRPRKSVWCCPKCIAADRAKRYDGRFCSTCGLLPHRVDGVSCASCGLRYAPLEPLRCERSLIGSSAGTAAEHWMRL